MGLEHPYLPTTRETQKEMLASMGLESLEDLFVNIPEKFRLRRELKIPEPHSEHEVVTRLRKLAAKNQPALDGNVFLGGGAGLHYIPATVTALGQRSEFVTAYTSYQPEVSQGMLQTLFEYQSLVAEILQMDVVNSSLYDLPTSLGEAARMTARVKKRRNRFLVPGTLNPVALQVLRTYTEPVGIQVESISFDPKTGLMSLTDLSSRLDDTVAGVYVENPSYLGFIETQLDEIAATVHDAGALLVAGVNILSLPLLRAPGEFGADIAIAEGQFLGNTMSFGGPMLGVFACKGDRKLVYQMPGRLVGMTTTVSEPHRRGFVLTLSAREQHIRREKATSNICSNQALMAVNAAVYLATMGPDGLREVAEAVLYNSNYAARQLDRVEGVTAPAVGETVWRDFAVQFDTVSVAAVHEMLLERGIHGGTPLTSQFPSLGEAMLFSVTELHTRESIDKMVSAIRDIVEGGA
ncbi:MAG: aminomethyl-transferring glycine dehydrogenase subunit GcvPA [Candidatus Thorarchaeota archaeon]